MKSLNKFSAKFGRHLAAPKGFIAKLGQDTFNHKFGGSAWQIITANHIADKPALLLTLDLQDPKLNSIKIAGLSELPLCSYINSNIWYEKQAYKIEPDKQKIIEVRVAATSPELLDETTWLPNPLPEKPLKLRAMNKSEYPTDEDIYWQACDNFVGGNAFLRILGPPLWLEDIEKLICDCGIEMEYVSSIGYEDYNDPGGIVDEQPMFIGESALYFFICRQCLTFHVISQST